MSGLDPTVTGALIAGGFAVIGFGASAASSAVTLRANRDAAHDQRQWEKRAPLYEQVLASAQILFSNATPAGGAEYDAAVNSLREFRPQVWAYASHKVLNAHRDLLDEIDVRHDAKPREVTLQLMYLIREELQPSEPHPWHWLWTSEPSGIRRGASGRRSTRP